MKEETNFGYLVYLPIVRRFSSECHRDSVLEMLMRVRLRQYFRDIEKALLNSYPFISNHAHAIALRLVVRRHCAMALQ